MAESDPLVSLPHRTDCYELHKHVAPIGFREGEEWNGSHGEAWRHGEPEQCMCGHVPYYWCPDWLSPFEASDLCQATLHDQCDTAGRHEYDGETQPNTCPCDCHAIPLSQALKGAA